MADILDNNSTTKQQVEYYIGFVKEVIDPVLYEIKVNVPGHFDGVRAFPTRNNIDEPRIGDFVILRSFDPIYHSFFLWEKTKENGFIGFRSNGKMISITPDYIEMSVFDSKWNDDQKDENYVPTPTSWVQLDKDGNLDISLNGDHSMLTINAADQADIYLNGDFKVWSGGNIDIQASGNCKVQATKIEASASMMEIKGPGILKVKGIAIPGEPGPFMIPAVAPAPGTPNITSNTIQLT